jgi:Arc/MetJ-type ribon-helix-helix transcriptional regulator
MDLQSSYISEDVSRWLRALTIIGNFGSVDEFLRVEAIPLLLAKAKFELAEGRRIRAEEFFRLITGNDLYNRIKRFYLSYSFSDVLGSPRGHCRPR